MPLRKHAELARALSETTFLDLFQRLDTKSRERLWDRGSARPALEGIIQDRAIDPHIRFLAAEILFTMIPDYTPSPDLREALNEIYSTTLQDAPRFPANPWGLPGNLDGQVAQHVLKLGDSAARALAASLDDTRPVTYEGSQEATLGNSYRFRVKDLAAALIAHIRHLPFVPDPDPAARDVAIRKVQEAVNTEPGEGPGMRRDRR